jgi:lipopolysaccharide transport system ATP-binding protein
MAKVELKGVWVEFPVRAKGSQSSYPALRDISLDLKSGDRLGILGPNGSGKTTLLRLISGIYPPTRGTVLVEGVVGSMLDLQLGINGRVSGRDNIIFRSRLLGRASAVAKQTVEDACEFGGLAEFLDQPVENYSSGMKMRLAFSIATAVPSEILVMDEWLSVGDEQFQAKAKGRIDSLVKQADILILASHNKKLLSSTCSRFLVLEKGVATELASLD